MSDRELIREILTQIQDALRRVERRFAPIQSPHDFLESEEGIDRLDGICMMLIVIGESLKNLDKVTKGDLLRRYPQVDWSGAKGMRDILSHHYFRADTKVVFAVCREKIPGLVHAITAMLRELDDGAA